MRSVLTITLITVVISFSFGATINVPENAATIQAGIEAASAGDTVLVAPGTYYENLNYNGKNISVISEGGPNLTIVDGSNNGPALQMVSGELRTALFQGFTVQNGNGLAGLTNPQARFGGGIA